MKLFLGVYLFFNSLSVLCSILHIHENVYPRIERRSVGYDLWMILGGIAFCCWAALIYYGVIK